MRMQRFIVDCRNNKGLQTNTGNSGYDRSDQIRPDYNMQKQMPISDFVDGECRKKNMAF
jgi:hypothetical protein